MGQTIRAGHTIMQAWRAAHEILHHSDEVSDPWGGKIHGIGFRYDRQAFSETIGQDDSRADEGGLGQATIAGGWSLLRLPLGVRCQNTLGGGA